MRSACTSVSSVASTVRFVRSYLGAIMLGKHLEGHRHAQILPLDLDGDGRLDHLLVHAPMGFGVHAQRALRTIRAIYAKDGRLVVTLAGLGELESFVRLGDKPVRELGEARVWISSTPFIASRHLKSKRHTLEDQIQAELAWRELPRATSVEVLDRETVVELRFHHFLRVRRDPERAPPSSSFFGLRIELERVIPGPLALGYASHFGLGLFVPESSIETPASIVHA